MAKGDWEVYEDTESRETPIHELSACQLYGHTFETVVDDNDEPVIVGTDYIRRCNDCAETHTYDPEDDI
jgi:hypothetical protein